MRTRVIIISICFAAFIAGVFYTSLNTAQNQFERAVTHANNAISKTEQSFASWTGDTAFIEAAQTGKLGVEQLQEVDQLPYHFFVYQKDSLLLWNHNTILLDISLTTIDEHGSLLQLKNGYYIGFKKEIDNTTFLALLLVKNQFAIENEYLKNEYATDFGFNKNTKIESANYEIGESIVSSQGKTLFKVIYQPLIDTQAHQVPLVVGCLTVLLCILFFTLIIIELKGKFGYTFGLLTLAVSSLIFRLLLTFTPFEFFKTTLFAPELYASFWHGSSLGMLFFNALIVLGFALYFFHWIQNVIKKNTRLLGVHIFISTATLLMLIWSSTAIRSLVLDSVISFEINHFIDLNIYTIFGLFILFMMLAAAYVTGLSFSYSFKYSLTKQRWFLLIGIIASVVLFIIGFGWLSLLVPLVFIGFLWIESLFSESYRKSSSYSVFISILFFASLQAAILLTAYNSIKNKNYKEALAAQLIQQRDIVAEYEYSKILDGMKNDPFIKKFFSNPLISSKELQQRINYLYLGDYMSQYNASIYPFNIDGNVIKSLSESHLEDFYGYINSAGEETYAEDLFFIPTEKGHYMYVSIIPIESNGMIVGTLAIEFTPKSYQKDNSFLGLLIEEKNIPIVQSNRDYDYAIYVGDHLASQAGEYPYPFDNEYADYKHGKQLKDFGFKHLIFKADNRTIVISNPKVSLIEPVSVFSYLFSFFLVLGILLLLIIGFFSNINPSNRKERLNISFRNRINFAIIAIIVSSFFIIGLITVRYFSNEYHNYHEQRLIRKQKAVLSALEYLIKDNSSTINATEFSTQYLFQNQIPTEIAALSDIHSMDINVFDLTGQLLLSSQPGIFSNELVSKQMQSNAFFTMKEKRVERLIQDESIGKLNYLAIYIPIRDVDGKAIAYLNLPYFAKEENLRNEISDFMVALINVYTLLLIGAGFVAFLVANSITSPLAQISEKLRKVNLSKKNEPISWQSNDEIGALVTEYNRMIAQLEQSAKLLAHSERESAWREMAKQIAHEIKNPLTPMKLSIQHLQRTIQMEPDRAPELAQRVSKTLIEQIENLTEIATAFSSFAKMPTAKNEVTDLKNIIETVVNLFSEKPEVNLTFDTNLDVATIFADKNQYISVFNNLVKNAIQATESTDNGKVSVSIIKENDYFQVRIDDNGVGIPDEMADKVFVPNFTTKSSGTGLGLAISKQIIESSGGSIWFESIENKGTSFFVVLPHYRS